MLIGGMLAVFPSCIVLRAEGYFHLGKIEYVGKNTDLSKMYI